MQSKMYSIPWHIDVNTHEPFKIQSLKEFSPTRAQGKFALCLFQSVLQRILLIAVTLDGNNSCT